MERQTRIQCPIQGRHRHTKTHLAGDSLAYEPTPSKRNPLNEIATQRGLSPGTVIGHLERLAAHGERIDVSRQLEPERFDSIRQEIERSETSWLSEIRDALGDGYSYDEIRLVRLHLQRSPNNSRESRSMIDSSSSSGSSGR